MSGIAGSVRMGPSLRARPPRPSVPRVCPPAGSSRGSVGPSGPAAAPPAPGPRLPSCRVTVGAGCPDLGSSPPAGPRGSSVCLPAPGGLGGPSIGGWGRALRARPAERTPRGLPAASQGRPCSLRRWQLGAGGTLGCP